MSKLRCMGNEFKVHGKGLLAKLFLIFLWGDHHWEENLIWWGRGVLMMIRQIRGRWQSPSNKFSILECHPWIGCLLHILNTTPRARLLVYIPILNCLRLSISYFRHLHWDVNRTSISDSLAPWRDVWPFAILAPINTFPTMAYFRWGRQNGITKSPSSAKFSRRCGQINTCSNE